MNPHILFVIDHLANPEKYTEKQLQDNRKAAGEAYDAACYDAAADAESTAYWVNEYFTTTGENKQDYVDKINKDNKQ